MLQGIKIVTEELIVNIQIDFLRVLALWYIKLLEIKEICKQESYNKQE